MNLSWHEQLAALQQRMETLRDAGPLPDPITRVSWDNYAIISPRALPAGNTNVVFVPNAGRELPEPNLRRAIPSLSESWLAAWMIRVGLIRGWTFLFRTRNRGTEWIPPFRNLSNTHQHQQRSK